MENDIKKEEDLRKFSYFLTELNAMEETYGLDHPLTQEALRRAILIAPAEVVEKIAADMGIANGKPDGYVNGEPIYSIESIAKDLGASVAEVRDLARGLKGVRVDSAEDNFQKELH